MRTRLIAALVAVAVLIALFWNGADSYAFIMVQRQTQLIRQCAFGSSTFEIAPIRARFSVPQDLCILPSRLFPAEPTIEILPRGWYFVFNEYAAGTVAKAAKGVIVFEPILPDRSPERVGESLVAGGFAHATALGIATTSHGYPYHDFSAVTGIDEARHDWAIFSADGQMLEIVTRTDEKALRDTILNSLRLY